MESSRENWRPVISPLTTRECKETLKNAVGKQIYWGFSGHLHISVFATGDQQGSMGTLLSCGGGGAG